MNDNTVLTAFNTWVLFMKVTMDETQVRMVMSW